MLACLLGVGWGCEAEECWVSVREVDGWMGGGVLVCRIRRGCC